MYDHACMRTYVPIYIHTYSVKIILHRKFRKMGKELMNYIYTECNVVTY